MECLERCAHQVFRPDSIGLGFLRKDNGVGDCSIYTYDPVNNSNCAKYTPIKTWGLEVEEREP